MTHNKIKKIPIAVATAASLALFDFQLDNLALKQTPLVASAATARYASITSRNNVSYSAVIQEKTRTDGVYFNGPALTSANTQTANAPASRYDGHEVQVEETNITRRSNGISYTYAKVRDAGLTYWIDMRALLRMDSISSTTTFGHTTLYLNESLRNDGVYFNGPALTSKATVTADAQGADYNGHLVQLLQIQRTQRVSNNTAYQYAQVRDGSRTYWIDARALFDTVSSTNSTQSGGYINESGRSDGVYRNAAPNTSTSAFAADASGSQFDNDAVVIQRSNVQRRGNGSTYTYAYVYDQTKNEHYWIDQRAVTPYAVVSSSTNLNNVTAYINQSQRNDGIYFNGPALTSSSTMANNGQGIDHNGHMVQVEKIVSTKRGANQTIYQYAQVKDGAQTFWIDVRALFDRVVSTSNTGSNGYIDQYGRSDGIYPNGAPFTNASSFSTNQNAVSYNNDPVTIQRTSVQRRGNGSTYTYVYVYDQTRNQSFWIDARAVSAQTLGYSGLSSSQRNWLNSVAPYAAQVADSNNLYASIMMAQAILESAWGTSALSTSPNNNFFGIKYNASHPSAYASGRVLMSTLEEDQNGTTYQISAYFNAYATASDSFLDYVSFLKNNSRYKNLFRNSATSYEQAANNLYSDGYATDLGYAAKLISIIKNYHLDILD